jgi:ribosomal-protein-alanine N-acetyltransferase
MLHVNFDPFPILTTDRLLLRRLTVADAPEIFTMRSDEHVMNLIGRPRAQSIDDAIQLIQRIDEGINTQNGINWAITLRDSNTFVGIISIWRLIKEHFRGEVGYMLHPQHYGRGITTEALTAVVHYGFHTMNLHSLEGGVNPANQQSIRVLEKCGFVREAWFKEDMYFNGQFRDSAVYSLLTPVKSKPEAEQ